jgi:hypothetical protein
MHDDMFLAVLSLVSVAVGVLLSELAAVFRQRREDKRRIRVVLYGLLNVHHQMAPVDSTVLLKTLRHWLQSTADQPVSDAEWSAACAMLNDFVNCVVERLKPTLTDKVLWTYEEAIRDLAAVDPFLAFMLSDRTLLGEQLKRYIESVKEYTTQWNSEAAQATDMRDWLPRIETALSSRMCSVIEDDIRSVARRVGWFTWWRAILHIKRRRVKYSERFQQEFNLRMNEAVKDLGSV